MRAPVVLCLIFGGCLLLELNECSRQFCVTNQYTVTWPNGSFKGCLKCAKCHPGIGLHPICGQSVTYPVKGIGCEACIDGKTFSDEYNSAPCSTCHSCAKHEIVAANCTRSSDTKCNGTCIPGYYYTNKPRHDCLRCSYCCYDGKDEIQQECIDQGLKTVKQYCSHRVDKTCGPDPTTMIILTTDQRQANTINTLANPSQPTNQGHHVKVAVIVSSIAIGLLFAVIVVGAILLRMRKVQRRRGSASQLPTLAMNVNETRPTEALTLENESSHVDEPLRVPRRVHALQNEGCSNTSTPQGSPSATPHQTDDELEELPDVSTLGRPKRFLKRLNSKEAQNVQNDVTGDSRASGRNEGQQNSKGAEGGPQRKHSRSGSIHEVIKRKLSFGTGDANYQPLSAEDQGEIRPGAEGGPQRKHSRSGSIQEVIRKLSFQGGRDTNYQLLPAKDPDEMPGNQDESSPTESITIEEHPTSQKQKEGSKVEFKCKAQGRREVSYQWLKDRTEIQGQNSPILSLDHVKLCDFGSYTCEVRSTDGQCVESSPAMLDVSPGDGMRLKCLTEVFRNSFNDQLKVQKLLVKKVHGAGGAEQVAFKYKMDALDVSSLERSQDAGACVIEFLKAQNPELTVYDFCKTLKEPNIRRLDIVKELLSHLSLPVERAT